MAEKSTEREAFVEEMKTFLQTCQDNFSDILQRLDWTPSHFIQQKESVICPHICGHVMGEEAMKKHEPVCRFTSRGVPKEVVSDESMRSSRYFYEQANSVCSVQLDKDILNQILWEHHVQNHSIFYGQGDMPVTPEEATSMLTPAERAAVYSYIVKTAKEQNKLLGLEADNLLTADFQEIVKKKSLEGMNAKPTSYTEYLKAMRDYKRRRQSYRAKNVHITRKSYTEIIKEVIENQTEYLTEIIKQDSEAAPKESSSRGEDILPENQTRIFDKEKNILKGSDFVEQKEYHISGRELKNSDREQKETHRRSRSREREGSRFRDRSEREEGQSSDRDDRRKRSSERIDRRSSDRSDRRDRRRSSDRSDDEDYRRRSKHKKSHKSHKHKHKKSSH